ncbi:MAG TPA: hypothetical protein VFG79_16635 [Solirubrobacter sp.]|nr:hypothetical protein [Solirubrobacter sp.]
MSRWTVVPALVLCALAAVAFGHFLLAPRDLVASTPSPRPMFQVTFVDLPPQQRLCLNDVTIPHDARQARFQVRTYGRPGPALDVELLAPGYRERLRVPAGYRDEALISAPMTPPREARLGRVCLRQDGAARISLVGTTEDRTRSRPYGDVDGEPVSADTYLAFYAGRTASALHETPAIVDRMGAFRPGIVGPWLLWPLLAIVVVGVPCGVIWAAVNAMRA